MIKLVRNCRLDTFCNIIKLLKNNFRRVSTAKKVKYFSQCNEIFSSYIITISFVLSYLSYNYNWEIGWQKLSQSTYNFKESFVMVFIINHYIQKSDFYQYNEIMELHFLTTKLMDGSDIKIHFSTNFCYVFSEIWN